MVVICLGKNLLLKSVLGHCENVDETNTYRVTMPSHFFERRWDGFSQSLKLSYVDLQDVEGQNIFF